jgi:hypothetical protein
VTVWGTSLTVPLAIAAANHGFGVLAGAIGIRTPGERRLKLAAALFLAGFGALIIAFALLMIFRAVAADSMNAALTALASGHPAANLQFFISPLWMGPLQVAGSFAAVSLTALWTMAKEGREYRSETLAPAKDGRTVAEADLTTAKDEIVRQKAQIAQTRAQLDAALLAPQEIEAEAEEARAQVICLTKEFQALVNTETALSNEMGAIYKTDRNYTRATYVNGGVWRMQRPTEYPKKGQPFTPGASDERSDPETIRQRHQEKGPQEQEAEAAREQAASSNGHDQDDDLDPEQFTTH